MRFGFLFSVYTISSAAFAQGLPSVASVKSSCEILTLSETAEYIDGTKKDYFSGPHFEYYGLVENQCSFRCGAIAEEFAVKVSCAFSEDGYLSKSKKSLLPVKSDARVCTYGLERRDCKFQSSEPVDLGFLPFELCKSKCLEYGKDYSCQWGEKLKPRACSKPAIAKSQKIDHSDMFRWDDDNFDGPKSTIKAFLGANAPLVGVLNSGVVNLFNVQGRQNQSDLHITFDGKIYGKIKIPKNAVTPETQFARFEYKGTERLPKSASISKDQADQNYIVTSSQHFSDPQRWKPRAPSISSIETGRKRVAEYVEINACFKPILKGKSPKDVIEVRWTPGASSNLKFIKSYRDKDGNELIGYSLNFEKIQFPKGVADCSGSDQVGDDFQHSTDRDVQRSYIYWYYTSLKGKSFYLGSGVPIDAGDYLGEGRSMFVFYSRPNDSGDGPQGYINFFRPDFSQNLEFGINYAGAR